MGEKKLKKLKKTELLKINISLTCATPLKGCGSFPGIFSQNCTNNN